MTTKIPQMAFKEGSFKNHAFKRKMASVCLSPCKLRLPTLISSFANIHSSEPQSQQLKRKEAKTLGLSAFFEGDQIGKDIFVRRWKRT